MLDDASVRRDEIAVAAEDLHLDRHHQLAADFVLQTVRDVVRHLRQGGQRLEELQSRGRLRVQTANNRSKKDEVLRHARDRSEQQSLQRIAGTEFVEIEPPEELLLLLEQDVDEGLGLTILWPWGQSKMRRGKKKTVGIGCRDTTPIASSRWRSSTGSRGRRPLAG